VGDVDKPLMVPVAAFRFARGGPRADSPPQPLGADTDAVLGDLGLTLDEIAVLRRDHVVSAGATLPSPLLVHDS